jgi:DNA polymerase III epsilon subunit-like protein
MILVFDTETTGLNFHPDAPLAKQPQMIEFGAMLLSRKDGSIVEEFNTLINPGVPLPAIITKITGLTDADLASAPTFQEVAIEIFGLFQKSTCMVAHNLPFDQAILRGELARMSAINWPWPDASLCTVGLYREVFGYNPKMTELYEQVMKKPLAQTHRALDDVRALVEIIQKDLVWKLA